MKRQFFERYEQHNDVSLIKINEDVYSDRKNKLVIRFIGKNKFDAESMLSILEYTSKGDSWIEHDLLTDSYIIYTGGIRL